MATVADQAEDDADGNDHHAHHLDDEFHPHSHTVDVVFRKAENRLFHTAVIAAAQYGVH